jgi:hypothetical protein
MNTVRAKFRVHNVTPYHDQQGVPNGYRVAMSPVYDSDPKSENGQFYQATPWGEIILGVMNPTTAQEFVAGAEVYVDFSPVKQ